MCRLFVPRTPNAAARSRGIDPPHCGKLTSRPTIGSFDVLRAAIARGDLAPLDADYMAGAMAGAALELGVRMAEREPADVEGAARFATQLFLGGFQGNRCGWA